LNFWGSSETIAKSAGKCTVNVPGFGLSQAQKLGISNISRGKYGQSPRLSKIYGTFYSNLLESKNKKSGYHKKVVTGH